MRLTDVARVGARGLGARRVRTALSALGIGIGIATMVAVVSIPASSKAALLAQLARVGNMLTVQSGTSFSGAPDPLPGTAAGMIRRIPPVQSAAAVGVVPGATVRRTAAVPAVNTGGIAVVAADASLPSTLGASIAHGAFLNAATARYPAVVLGNAAAATLGIPDVREPAQVYIGSTYFAVVGILNLTPLSPEIDDSVLVGTPVAERLLGFSGAPTQIYVRAAPDQVGPVRGVLAATANPAHPEAVDVSRPSDALAARASARGAFNGLLLGLGAVALLVGGIGIANVMIISVLERRTEIGLRRSLGATKTQIAGQFVTESLILAAIGGGLGVVLGVLGTIVAARAGHNPVAVPATAAAGALIAAIVVGVLAGFYPAARAARLAPTDALRASP